jgi:transposase-like protein
MLKDNAPDLLSNIVEIDETYVGGKDTNRHKNKKREGKSGMVHKTPMFGILERGNKVFAQKVDRAQAKMLKPIIYQRVKKDTMVVTDGFGAYRGIDKYYKHFVVNHEIGEYARGIYHTNTIEGFWSLFKRGILGIYHSVSPKHIDRYCSEFTYRYNHRELTQDDIVKNAMVQSEGRRLKYKELTAKVS